MKGMRAIALVCLGLALGAVWPKSHGARQDDRTMELYGTFVDAVEQIQANYVQPVERKVLVESALRGMLAELDPHSTFLNESDWRLFQKQVEGSFSGVGVQIDIDRKSGRPVVIAPLVGSPAYAAGVLAGDMILEIDGEATDDWSRETTIQHLTGQPGTDIALTVMHPGAEEPETLRFQRAMIELDAVLGDHRDDKDRWDFFIDHDRKIGYVRIAAFTAHTAGDVRKALEELKAGGMKGLVLDVRDDPGGLLSAAVEVADLFLPKGTIVSTRGRAMRDRTFEADDNDILDADQDLPIAVLINQNSASASEILAAALQDHKRAKIVGQRSFGKGSVQNILPLDDGGNRLKLTIATYFRPSEKNIHRFKGAKATDEWGVSPDDGLEVVMDDKQYVAWATARQRRDTISRSNRGNPNEADAIAHDTQLGKAIEEVAKAITDKS